MPSSKLPMPGLLMLLGIVAAVNAYDDLFKKPEDVQETPEDYAARILKVLPDDIAQIRDDGIVVLKNGSIRRL